MELAQMIRTHLDGEGRLLRFPARRRQQLAAIAYLAGKLPVEGRFTEPEMGALLGRLHTFGDPALLRRELCELGFWARARDGSAYWPAADPPTLAALGLE